LTVAAGQYGSAVSFTLAAAAAVSGTVTDPAQNDLAGALVVVTPTCTNSCFTPLMARSDPTGQYSIGFLPAGMFTVCFYGANATSSLARPVLTGYGDACYDGTSVGSGTPVTLTAGATKTDVNGTLTKLP
jgi:hypothetical protein